MEKKIGRIVFETDMNLKVWGLGFIVGSDKGLNEMKFYIGLIIGPFNFMIGVD